MPLEIEAFDGAVTRRAKHKQREEIYKTNLTVPFVPTQMPIIEIDVYAIAILKSKVQERRKEKAVQIRTMSTPTDTNISRAVRLDHIFHGTGYYRCDRTMDQRVGAACMFVRIDVCIFF